VIRREGKREREREARVDAFSICLHLLHVSLLIRAKVGEDGLGGIARGRFILFCIVPTNAFLSPPEKRIGEEWARELREGGREDRHPSPG